MGNPSGWDARLQFEQYVYDYMRKSGRTEAAEIFRRETNLPIDCHAPPEIDVPDGFLHEWWLTNFDFLKTWEANNQQHNEGVSNMDVEMMNRRQQSDPALPEQHVLNEQRMRELNVNSDFGLTIGHASMPSMELSQAFTAPPPPPGNIDDTSTPKLDCLLQADPKTGKSAPKKRGRKKKSEVPEVGSEEMPGANSTRMEASSIIPKDLQVVADLSSSHVKAKKATRRASSKKGALKMSSSHVKGKKDEAGNSSGKDSLV